MAIDAIISIRVKPSLFLTGTIWYFSPIISLYLDVYSVLFRRLQNQKGITLVELLAALSLFAVVIAISSTIIVQMMGGTLV